MTAEMGAGAIGIVPETQQNATLQPQSLAAPMQAMLAQRFEESLAQASQIAALSFQAAEESRRRSAAAQRETFRTADIPEVRVQPPSGSETLVESATDYLDGYGQRVKSLFSEMEKLGSLEKTAPVHAAALGEASALGSATVPDNKPEFDPVGTLKLVQNTFTFAIETHLISTVATQGSGIFNQLMKGQ